MPEQVTYILLDRPDGEFFIEEAWLAGNVPLALTPEAAAPLVSRGVPHTEPTTKALEWANARATVEAKKFSRWVQAGAARLTGLSPAGLFSLDRMLRRPCVTGTRIWSLLRGKPSLGYRDEGRWVTTSDRMEVYASLMRRLGARIPNYKFLPEEKRVSRAFTALGHVAAILQGLHGSIFYNTIRKHFANLADDVQAVNASVMQFGAEGAFNAQWTDVVNLTKSLRAGGEKKRRFVAGIDRAAYRKAEREAFSVLDEISEPLMKLAVDPQRQSIATEVAATEGYAAWFSKIFYWHRPKAVLVNAMSTGLNVALAQAARLRKIPALLVSHCSVGEGPLRSPLHGEALGRRNRDLCASDFADIQVVQSPHAEAASKILAPSARRFRVRPVIWGATQVTPDLSKKAEEFTILHAGNFQAWHYYETFSSECSLEYVRGILELAETVRTLPRCKLVIRMKPGHEHKTECLLEGIQARLPGDLNHRFSTTGSFYDELAAADLLISSTSTVIEESLLGRIPVLLHSGGRIKPFFPARTTLPTALDRAAVYAVKQPGDLPAMLRAIAETHFQKPLTDEEILPHSYGADVPSRKDFAAYLVNDMAREALEPAGKYLKSHPSPR